MDDCREPPHVHVSGGNGAAKVWLKPISVARVAAYSRHEMQIIERLVVRNAAMLREKWDEECQRHG